jgi:hypothetical protein
VYKRQRGFANPPFVFDLSGEYTRTYVNADDADVPGFSVFTRRDGVIRHFYSGEMSGVMAAIHAVKACCAHTELVRTRGALRLLWSGRAIRDK